MGFFPGGLINFRQQGDVGPLELGHVGVGLEGADDPVIAQGFCGVQQRA